MNSTSRLASYVFNLKTLTTALLAALLCAQAAAQEGQTAARPDRGVNAGGAYSVSDVENISLQNGNVGLSIPLASLPPIAGGKLSLTLKANYNSRLWNVTRSEQANGFPSRTYVVDTPQLSDAGGWYIGGRYFLNVRYARDDFDYAWPPSPNPNDGSAVLDYQRATQNWYKVIVRTPDGAEHELRPTGGGFQTYGGIDYPRSYLWGYHTGVPSVTGAPVRYETTDGTFISAVYNPPNHASGVNWTLFLPDGTQVIDYGNGLQRIRDTNGNAIKIFSDGAGEHYQDEQSGRELRVEFDPAASGGYGQVRVWYQTVGGVAQHVDLNLGMTVVRGKLYQVNDWNSSVYTETGQQGDVCRRHQQLTPQEISVVREIVFPQTEPNTPGRRFSFFYNSDETETVTTQGVFYYCGSYTTETYTRTASRGMGALGRMVTPSGAEVSYTYQLASKHDFIGLDESNEMARETLTAKDVAHDGVTDHWTYDIPFNDFASGSSVTNPDGSTSSLAFYSVRPDFPGGNGGGHELGGRVYVTSDGHTVTHTRWQKQGSTWATGTDTYTAFNPYIQAEYTSLLEGGVAVKMSARVYEHDFNGNATKVTEYNWFDPASVQREAGTGIPTGVPAGAVVLRVTNTSYHNPAASMTSPNYYRLRGLTTGVPSFLGAVKETSTGASRTRYSYDNQAYGAAPTAGNPTQVSRLDDGGDADASNDTWVTPSTAYGPYGNPSSTTDANGRVTQLFYDDATHALPTRVVVDPLNGTGTQTTTTAYDHWTGLVTSVTDANGQNTTIDYTNLLLGTVDPFARPGVASGPVVTAGGQSQRRKVFTFYEEAARRVRTESDLHAEGDRLLKSRTTHDQLGRAVLSEQNEGGAAYTISSQTVHAQAGRVTLQSSPARGSSPESWSRVTKDTYGRVVEAATFGGAAQPSATAPANSIANWTGSVTNAYASNETTVVDQTGRTRKSVADALGRVVQAVEAPNVANYGYATDYVYDALGNLRRVGQGGQFRYFMYDSLSRLIRAKNPEQGGLTADAHFPALTDSSSGTPNDQWSTGYRYDAAGNLLKRKDARGVVTTHVYDGLNRNTSVTYTTAGSGAASTPNVVRSYDAATLGKGRLSFVAQSGTYGAATYIDTYDAAGRPLVQRQKFETNGVWSADYTASYAYDLAGNIKTQTYPSGRSVAYTYDNAGRLGGFTGNLGDGASRTYADSFDYDASRRVRQERFGTATPVYNKHLFNSRGQLAEIRVSTYSLFAAGQETNWNRGAIINHYSDSGWGASGGGPDNNGNLRRQEVYIPNDDAISGYFNVVQYYGYDALNRLTSVEDKPFNGSPDFYQAYTYDRWGNRTVNAGGTWNAPAPQFSVEAASNRLGVPAGQSGAMGYDAAGNLTLDTYQGGLGGGGTRAYDAENRMASAQFLSGQTQTASYAYDADGRRVRLNVGTSGELWQIYGVGGELLAEYAAGASPSSPQKEYGYRGGELLVTAAAGGGTASPAPRANVAAASAGATATASTAYDAYGLTTARAINGSRTYAGSYWNDQTVNSLPDWLQIDFAGTKTISEVDLFFLQDNYATADPTEAMTFTQFGITSFDVQYWTGSSWANVPGGGVTGNNKVWRRFTFSPVTTDKIRVVVNAAMDGWSRVVEVEAYEGAVTASASADVRWLVTDQLGTPRMVLDKTGSLAGVTRHDYLPFGEEIAADATWRTPGRGYGGDPLRQKFTGYERDVQTGLDFAQARYYASQQGRFTSPDPLLKSGTPLTPASWNRYAYAFNNPLAYTDPTGLINDYYVERDGYIIEIETEDATDRVYYQDGLDYVLIETLQRNSNGLVKFPDSGTGFDRYGTVDAGGQDINPKTKSVIEDVGEGDHYLQPVVAAALLGLTRRLNSEGLTLSLGDMSSSNGSDPWQPGSRHHGGHGHQGTRSGKDVDFRYLNGDGVSFQSQTAFTDSQFSSTNNQTVYDRAALFGFTANYQGTAGNNPLTGPSRVKGHNDHGHLGFGDGSKVMRVKADDQQAIKMRGMTRQ